MKSSIAGVVSIAVSVALVVAGNLLILYVAVRVVRAAWAG